MTRYKKSIICFLILCFIAAAFLTGYCLIAKNYNNINGYNNIENCRLNVAEKSFENEIEPIRLYGEWEFFYNQFIVSDNLDVQKSETIFVPDKWTGKTYQGKALDNTGFASYRLYIDNVPKGEKVVVCNDFCDVAFRVFVNKQLCFQTGTVSKNIAETKTTGTFDYVMPYEVSNENQTLEIVIEVSNNNMGGLYKTPLYTSENIYTTWTQSDWYSNALTYFVMGMLIIIILIQIIFNVVINKNKQGLFSVVAIVSLFLHFFTTIDAYRILTSTFGFISYSAIHCLSIITAFVYICSVLLLYLRHCVKNKKQWYIHGAVAFLNLICVVLFLCFKYINVAYLILLPCFLSCLYYLFMFAHSVAKKQKYSIINSLVYIFSLIIIFCEFTDNLGLLEVGNRTLYNYGILWVLVLYLFITFDKLKNINNIAKNVEKIKNDNLKKQIASGNLSNEIKIYTFGQFNVFIGKNVVNFKSAKSKELLALLVDKLGGELTIDEVITRLYPEKDPFLAKKSYRDILIKLRETLKNNNIENLITTERGKISLNKNMVAFCDLWEYIENPKDIFVDEYMISYDWAVDRLMELDNLKNN